MGIILILNGLYNLVICEWTKAFQSFGIALLLMM